MENTQHRLSVWGQDSKKTGHSSTANFKQKDSDVNNEDQFSKSSTRLDAKDVWKALINQLGHFGTWMLWLNVSRLNLLYIIIEVIIYCVVGSTLMNSSFIVFMLVAYLIILLVESSFFFYFYLKVRELESKWDSASISKLNAEKKNWTNTQIRRLKVGDLVLLKRNTVAPADLLIIDTSDSHFSDQILYTNERRVTGQNIMTTKRAIKNLRGKNHSKNQYEVLKTILPALEGQIEYEAPSDNVIDFGGYFKLNSDPQISRITHRNVLFCGTQLHTAWMIGLVLFTGQSTKILQMNMAKLNQLEKLTKDIKISRTSKLINWLMFIYLVFSLCLTALYYIIRAYRKDSMQAASVIEEFALGSSNGFVHFLLVLQGPLMFLPQLSVLLYEVACFVVGLQIQRMNKSEIDARIEAANKNIQRMTSYQGRKQLRKKSTKLMSIDSFNESQRNSVLVEGSETLQRNIASTPNHRGRATANFGSANLQSVSLTPVNRPFRRENTPHSGSRAHSKRRSETGFIEQANLNLDRQDIRVINYEALPNLGSITHVVFDKTDTLTMSAMHVCQVATTDRIYKVENESRLKELMDLYDTNPQAFEFQEDIEENKAKENSFYSEKSQEYQKEINGEYVAEVQDNSSLDDIFAIEHPTYNLTGKTTVMNGDKTESEDGSLNSITLKQGKNNSGPTQPLAKGSTLNFGNDDSFVELGLLEKEFKKMYQLKSESSEAESSTEKDFFSVLRQRVRIKINNDKQMTDKHLVADIRQRDESLEELLSYVYTMHLIEYGPQNQEERSKRPEDEALINVISSLGFYQMKSTKHKVENLNLKAEDERLEVPSLFSFEYETVGGLRATTHVHSMSIFSQKRGRRSIIISSEPSESEPYLLVTFGTEKSMRHLVRPSRNKKEDNLLKVMIAKQKQRGYKVLIVCKKALSEEQVLTYTKEYTKISCSARDQLEDLENLAMQIENDMEYVGCIGLRDSIHEEAIELTSELNKSRIPMSIMSGDELENCLTVVNKLGISYIDIQNSSSFFSINANQEKSLVLQMRRIFDCIHDNLQTESYMDIENLLKAERDSLMDSESLKKTEKKESNVQEEERETITTAKKITTYDVVNKFKRPLLISGRAVECIMNYPSLVNHLAAIVLASGTIIAYDLMPKHKAFLIQVLRDCGEIVLAIGDGFNDIGMLNRANFGIQISNENVPLIFGDIVTSSLSNITPILFQHGFKLKKNLSITFILVVWFSCLIGFFPLFMAYYSYMLPFFSLNALTISSINMIYPVLIIFAIVNENYSKAIIKRLPMIYRENKVLIENLPNIMIVVFVWALIESTLIATAAIFFVSTDISSQGHPSVIWNASDLYVNFLIFSLVIKTLLLIRKKLMPFICILLAGIALALISFFSFDNSSRALVGYTKWSSFGYSSFTKGLAILVIGENYLSYLLISFLNKSYFHPSSSLFDMHCKEEDEPLTNDAVMAHLSSLTRISKTELHIQIINSIKRIFRGAKMVDPALRRIFNIDFHHSNMGLSSVMNRILDQDERKRFDEYIIKTIDIKWAKYFFATMTTLAFIEWLINIFISKAEWPAAMDMMSPYVAIFMLCNLIVAFVRPKFLPYSFLRKTISSSCHVSLYYSVHWNRFCPSYSKALCKYPNEAHPNNHPLQSLDNSYGHFCLNLPTADTTPVAYSNVD